MVDVMCAQGLWQVVRHWTLEPAAGRASPPGRLGHWAATRFREGDKDLVIAVSEIGCLTVVIPLRTATEFRPAFREAVRAALIDLDVPLDPVMSEYAAADPAALTWLRQPALRAYLNDLRWFCGIEAETHADLRIVQRNLNLVPFAPVPECVPALEVRALFGVAERGPRGAVH